MGTIFEKNSEIYEVNDNYLLPCLTIGNTCKSDLKLVYVASTEEAALNELELFKDK